MSEPLHHDGEIPPPEPDPSPADSWNENAGFAPLLEVDLPPAAPFPTRRLPSLLAQFQHVLLRRIRIFLKETGQVWLQLALVVAFPLLVAIFAWNGLPQVQNLSMSAQDNIVEQLSEAAGFTAQAGKVGGLVSGLVMIQVVLLTLMASNNGAREVAGERLILEKEKLAGLRVAGYLGAKVFFLFLLVAAQSIWMEVFVKYRCQIPGDVGAQLFSLFLTNAAMTSVCLAISCWASSPEQASMISIYLVGFQLPLSGAVLALPEPLGALVRPFITAYWGWSSYLQTIQDTRYYDVVRAITETPLSPTLLCWWILAGHIVLGLVFAYLGCLRSRWDN